MSSHIFTRSFLALILLHSSVVFGQAVQEGGDSFSVMVEGFSKLSQRIQDFERRRADFYTRFDAFAGIEPDAGKKDILQITSQLMYAIARQSSGDSLVPPYEMVFYMGLIILNSRLLQQHQGLSLEDVLQTDEWRHLYIPAVRKAYVDFFNAIQQTPEKAMRSLFVLVGEDGLVVLTELCDLLHEQDALEQLAEARLEQAQALCHGGACPVR